MFSNARKTHVESVRHRQARASVPKSRGLNRKSWQYVASLVDAGALDSDAVDCAGIVTNDGNFIADLRDRSSLSAGGDDWGTLPTNIRRSIICGLI